MSKGGCIVRRLRGFTLVEVLVVITVITVLVAVAMPVAIQVRNRARTAACLSHLRQLGGGLLLYAQDWNDRLPEISGTPFPGSVPTREFPEGTSATQCRMAMAKAVGSSQIFRCANDTGAPEYGFHAKDGAVFSRAGCSYVPWSTVRAGRYGLAVNGANVSSLLSTCVLLRDYGSEWHSYVSRSGMSLEAMNVANAVFADGHAADLPVFRFQIGDRQYACAVTSPGRRSGAVTVCGGSGGVESELTGRHTTTTNGQFQVSLSGTVTAGGVTHNVDRVFLFGDDKPEAACRQIVFWIESLVSG